MPASNHPTPAKPRFEGYHWDELTATLSCESIEILAAWMERDLAEMEQKLESYVTPNSLLKSLRR